MYEPGGFHRAAWSLHGCCRRPPGGLGVSKGLQHELTPEVCRSHDETSVSWTNPPWHALSPVIDADLVANLRDILGQGHQRLKYAPQGEVFVAGRLRCQPQ